MTKQWRGTLRRSRSAACSDRAGVTGPEAGALARRGRRLGWDGAIAVGGDE
jgi:hypothetical protein